MRAASALALALLVVGCKAKPIAEVPSLSADKGPDTTDRPTPSGKTLAAALPLLDARITGPAELERRRAEFEQRLNTLVTDPKTRDNLGFTSLLSWHQVYSRGRSSWLKAAADLDDRLHALGRPPKGHELRIDENGVARVCPVGTPDACRPVTGPAQLDGDAGRLAEQLDTLLEAHWFLVTGLEKLSRDLQQAPAPR